MKYYSKIILALFLSLHLPAAETDEALIQEQKQQTATAITIIFDDSGSMRDRRKMKQAKTAFYEWLQTQSDDTRFSLINFEKDGKIQVPLGEGTKDRVLQKVKQLKPQYNTPIANCIKIAARQISERREKVAPYERHILVVFTDGQENRAKGGNKAVVAAIRSLISAGNGVEVVGIGFHGEGDYMKRAATSFYTADNAAQLRETLDKVSSEVPADVEFDLTPEEAQLMETMDFHTAVPQAHKSLDDLLIEESSSLKPSGTSKFPWLFLLVVGFTVFKVFTSILKKMVS